MTALKLLAVVVAVVATGLADVRWLRVAQREHYLPGTVSRFALRWWLGFGPNRVLAVAAVLGVVLSPVSPLGGVVGAAGIAVGPFGYSLRGRSPGPMVLTPRLRTVAAVTVFVQVVIIAAAAVLGAAVPVAALMALVAPLVMDGALAILRPVEDHKAQRYVDAARTRLQQVAPTVVAITGSYGKTTTKVYAAHLIAATRTVVPTPASFNNRAGLSRAINENLVPGTDVFIAEMGTYGPGEIAELCSWCPPRVAAITAIGPVHLERFGDEDAIVRAKSEILDGAEIVVLNVDDPRLAAVADARAAAGVQVVRCSTEDPAADVAVRAVDGRVLVTRAGEPVADLDPLDVPLGNVAVAVALSFAVGVPVSAVATGLPHLPPVASRGALTTLSTGATAIDDTFNSNPAGCRAALATLARLGRDDHKRVVVTPGMVELGTRQAEANAAFAAQAATLATHLVIVAHTNRAALLAGVGQVPPEGRAAVLVVDTHEAAVAWVKVNTSDGDVVLYENQLPDHYA